MSGPIIRKYGFPNFEQIFGERAAQHGVEENEDTPYKPAEPVAPLGPKAPNQPAATDARKPTEGLPSPNPDDPAGRATTTEIEPATEFGNSLG